MRVPLRLARVAFQVAIGFDAVCASSAAIRGALGDMLVRGERPLLVGGDCTLLIGACAALKQHFGRYGLAFVDGHLISTMDAHRRPARPPTWTWRS